jgi:hypothetical protein
MEIQISNPDTKPGENICGGICPAGIDLSDIFIHAYSNRIAVVPGAGFDQCDLPFAGDPAAYLVCGVA